MHLHEVTALADTKTELHHLQKPYGCSYLIHLTVAASCYNFESVSSRVQAQHCFAIFFLNSS